LLVLTPIGRDRHGVCKCLLIVQGRLDYRGDEANLIIDKIVNLDNLSASM